jgi:hypothetical protein
MCILCAPVHTHTVVWVARFASAHVVKSHFHVHRQPGQAQKWSFWQRHLLCFAQSVHAPTFCKQTQGLDVPSSIDKVGTWYRFLVLVYLPCSQKYRERSHMELTYPVSIYSLEPYKCLHGQKSYFIHPARFIVLVRASQPVFSHRNPKSFLCSSLPCFSLKKWKKNLRRLSRSRQMLLNCVRIFQPK